MQAKLKIYSSLVVLSYFSFKEILQLSLISKKQLEFNQLKIKYLFPNKNIKPNATYDVIGIDYDCFRIVNEVREPILYPKFLFEVIDSSIPDSWTRVQISPDEYYINPQELSEPGFYEDLFDGVPEAKAVFEKFLTSAGIEPKDKS